MSQMDRYSGGSQPEWISTQSLSQDLNSESLLSNHPRIFPPTPSTSGRNVCK